MKECCGDLTTCCQCENMGKWLRIHNQWFFETFEYTLEILPIKHEKEGLGKKWKWKIKDKYWKVLKSGSCYTLKCAKYCVEKEYKNE